MKYNILSCINPNFQIEKVVNPFRINIINPGNIKNGHILYFIDREYRAKDNYALMFAIHISKSKCLPLEVIALKNTNSVKNKQLFLEQNLLNLQNDFKTLNIAFKTVDSSFNLHQYMEKEKIATLVIDFNPIRERNFFKNCSFSVFEVDSHNIIPARFASNKQEYNAFWFRKKIYSKLWDFLTEYPQNFIEKNDGDKMLESFIEKSLEYYYNNKNNPIKNGTSNLSKYINRGIISSQRIALKIIKTDCANENKEAFLEELIVRKELADNFCLYAKDYKSFKDIPNWSKDTINKHRKDIREIIYNNTELENAQSHDNLWNATQKQLVREGKIHGYMRMYWAKKIFEWSKTPEEALKTAIFLNDKYGFDAPSSNGYTGILWSIAGLHDRAFKEKNITGKIRTMTYNGVKSKYEIMKYIEKYN